MNTAEKRYPPQCNAERPESGPPARSVSSPELIPSVVATIR